MKPRYKHINPPSEPKRWETSIANQYEIYISGYNDNAEPIAYRQNGQWIVTNPPEALEIMMRNYDDRIIELNKEIEQLKNK